MDLQEQAILLKKVIKREEKIPEYVPLFSSDALKKADELKSLHKEFFEASQKSRKDAIKTRIDTMEWELVEATLREQDKTASLKALEGYKRANVRPFFLWKFHFAEAFQEKGGFDVVIANPPYVRQETIRHLKPHLAKSFGEFYCGTANIYTYFYKGGIDLLKPGGHLCFIAPNKFMRAGYGKNTRILLTTRVTPKLVIDFGDLPIFDATTYPSILLIEKREPEETDKTIAATFTDSSQLERLEETLSDIAFSMPVKALRREGWNLEKPEILALMEKLRSSGIPLGEYVQGKFYRGVLTGLNEAFVIDAATREKIIAEDPKNADLIKPWLRGRDIRKWKAEWAGLYVIFTRRGTDVEQYPAIKHHLEQFRKDLEPKRSDKDKRGRKPGSYKWFEVQDNIAYFDEFEKPKIMYAEISTEGKFLLETEGYYSDTTTYIISSTSEYLLGVLNSKLFTYMFSKTSSEISGGFFRWKRQYMELIPIFPATNAQKAPIIERVRKIHADPDSPDVPRLEEEINKLIYNLYSLTDAEIALVTTKT